MTLTEAREIFGYWERNPPDHLMLQAIARMLGWTPLEPFRRPSSDIAEMAAMPPPGLVVVRGPALGMPSPLDVDALRERNRLRALQTRRRQNG